MLFRSTVGSGGASSVTFSNIPQTYTDLKLVCSLRNTSTNTWASLIFNGASQNFSMKNVLGNQSGTNSQTVTNYIYTAQENATGDTASTFSNAEIYIPNYTSTTNKSFSIDTVRENNSSTNFELFLWAGLYTSSSAITSISLGNQSGNFAEFSTVSLYGISSNTSTQNTTTPYALEIGRAHV